MIAAALLTLVAIACAKETRQRDLTDVEPPAAGEPAATTPAVDARIA